MWRRRSDPISTPGGAKAPRSLKTRKAPFYSVEEEEVAGRGMSAMLTVLQHCGRNLLTPRTVQSLNKSSYSTQMAKRVAVVLAGCGVYDGSEIHEVSAVLVHLSRGGASVSLQL